MARMQPYRRFTTGATRKSGAGKGRFDLIPPGPLRRLAQRYEQGAAAHGPRNWEKGIPLGSFLDSALRHLNDFRDGDRSEDHLAAAAWNVFGFMFVAEMIEAGKLPAELDDAGYLKAGRPVVREKSRPPNHLL
jgi:hypothetical protein